MVRRGKRGSWIDLDWVFEYHAPTKEQGGKYERIRRAAKVFAGVILRETPDCADMVDSLGKVREAVMMANAAVALEGSLSGKPEGPTLLDSQSAGRSTRSRKRPSSSGTKRGSRAPGSGPGKR